MVVRQAQLAERLFHAHKSQLEPRYGMNHHQLPTRYGSLRRGSELDTMGCGVDAGFARFLPQPTTYHWPSYLAGQLELPSMALSINCQWSTVSRTHHVQHCPSQFHTALVSLISAAIVFSSFISCAVSREKSSLGTQTLNLWIGTVIWTRSNVNGVCGKKASESYQSNLVCVGHVKHVLNKLNLDNKVNAAFLQTERREAWAQSMTSTEYGRGTIFVVTRGQFWIVGSCLCG